VALIVAVTLGACASKDNHDDMIYTTSEILLTSESGEKIAPRPNVEFREGRATGTVISVHPDSTRQVIQGIGTSFTESSAFVLAHLEPERRREVMEKIYGESGGNFSLTRTHIGSCDFSVEGKYSYAEEPGDTELASFTIAPDETGFDPQRFPGIKDPDFDLLPMIQEALLIKQGQREKELRIIASAWTAPPWMKDIETWFIPGSAENQWQGTGGSLKPGFEATYAEYLVKYLEAYRARGVEIWGLTPVNEPHGNSGFWESMHFTPESQGDFIRSHLGPRIQASPHAEINLLIFDQNRDQVEEWADVIFGDPASAGFATGIAVHWYSSTFKVYEETFERMHAKFPDKSIIHTEGCIDNLGIEAPDGVEDPEGFKESGWFQDDSFWWNPNATDWAYSATWAGPAVVDHPAYTPVHRYARDIIVGLNHWVSGWVDWNAVLDQDGGPNHVGNFCGAPIMIDTTSREVYYTPVYHVLAQLSRTIRPGDRAVLTERTLNGLDPDTLHACATISDERLLTVQLLNTTKEATSCSLQIADQFAEIMVPANSLQTVRVQLR
jgi:glucosylceramidase